MPSLVKKIRDSQADAEHLWTHTQWTRGGDGTMEKKIFLSTATWTTHNYG
jgi:hypothetical protein